MVAGFVWAMVDNHVSGEDARWLAWGITLFAGLTMITNLRFYSGKDINLRKSVPFLVIVLIAMGFGLVSIDPPIMLFLVFLAYGLSGYVMWARRRLQRKGRDALPPRE